MDWQPSVVLVDEDEPRYVEPWQPRIGQRVRVRLSGECTGGAEQRHIPAHGDCNGLIGTVLEFGRAGTLTLGATELFERGHRYYVEFGDGGWFAPGGIFAAIELEPTEEVQPTEQPAVASREAVG